MEITIKTAKSNLSEPEAKLKTPNRGYGALKYVLDLPPGWDSLGGEEEFANQFEVVREAKGLPPL
jgi:hypothetical protein